MTFLADLSDPCKKPENLVLVVQAVGQNEARLKVSFFIADKCPGRVIQRMTIVEEVAPIAWEEHA